MWVISTTPRKRINFLARQRENNKNWALIASANTGIFRRRLSATIQSDFRVLEAKPRPPAVFQWRVLGSFSNHPSKKRKFLLGGAEQEQQQPRAAHTNQNNGADKNGKPRVACGISFMMSFSKEGSALNTTRGRLPGVRPKSRDPSSPSTPQLRHHPPRFRSE